MKNVRIESSGGTSNSSKIFNSDGTEIQGVQKIVIDLTVNDIVRAKIDLRMIDVVVEAQAEYQLIHPKTGNFKKVRRVEFDDGEVIEL